MELSTLKIKSRLWTTLSSRWKNKLVIERCTLLISRKKTLPFSLKPPLTKICSKNVDLVTTKKFVRSNTRQPGTILLSISIWLQIWPRVEIKLSSRLFKSWWLLMCSLSSLKMRALRKLKFPSFACCITCMLKAKDSTPLKEKIELLTSNSFKLKKSMSCAQLPKLNRGLLQSTEF